MAAQNQNSCFNCSSLYQASTIMTVATLVFLWSWNNYLLPLITLNKQAVYTLPLMISKSPYPTDRTIPNAGAGSFRLPSWIIFILGSKYFVKGLLRGGEGIKHKLKVIF